MLPFSTGSSFARGLVEAAIIGAILLFGNVSVIGSRLDSISAKITRVQTQLSVFDARIRSVEKLSAVNAQRLTDNEPNG